MAHRTGDGERRAVLVGMPLHLGNWGRKIVLRAKDGRMVILVGDRRRKKAKRQKMRVYAWYPVKAAPVSFC